MAMPISADSPSDETLNRGPLALHFRRQYEFTFGINIGLASASLLARTACYGIGKNLSCTTMMVTFHWIDSISAATGDSLFSFNISSIVDRLR